MINVTNMVELHQVDDNTYSQNNNTNVEKAFQISRVWPPMLLHCVKRRHKRVRWKAVLIILVFPANTRLICLDKGINISIHWFDSFFIAFFYRTDNISCTLTLMSKFYLHFSLLHVKLRTQLSVLIIRTDVYNL